MDCDTGIVSLAVLGGICLLMALIYVLSAFSDWVSKINTAIRFTENHCKVTHYYGDDIQRLIGYHEERHHKNNRRKGK